MPHRADRALTNDTIVVGPLYGSNATVEEQSCAARRKAQAGVECVGASHREPLVLTAPVPHLACGGHIVLPLSSEVEFITLLGSANVGVIGSHTNNTITGNSGSNDLFGEGGNDIIKGEASSDLLVGGPATTFLMAAPETML
jgi:Ca2+-binding RTX toxin-like protein